MFLALICWITGLTPPREEVLNNFQVSQYYFMQKIVLQLFSSNFDVIFSCAKYIYSSFWATIQSTEKMSYFVILIFLSYHSVNRENELFCCGIWSKWCPNTEICQSWRYNIYFSSNFDIFDTVFLLNWLSSYFKFYSL